MSEQQQQDFIVIDKMSVDQLAGAVVLILGAIGSLLLVVWQSKCHCKVNLCYIFSCERRPPNEDEMKSLKDQAKKMKDKQDKKKEDDKKEDEETPKLIPKTASSQPIMEPEPEPEIDKLV